VLGLKYDSIENYLKSYGKYIVRQAKGLLKFNTATGKLQGSLKHKVEETKDGFELKFLASRYATFVNKGVSGTKVRRTYIDEKGRRKVSPYRFKKQPPTLFIENWIKTKGIKGRDKKGRFIKRKSLAFLIARSIKKKGLRGLSFYTQPLSWSYKVFKKEMEKSFKEDVLKGIKVMKLKMKFK
tara:strand:- start:10 stop:555 length:546 start_codon:yes stop_codon:yes gene_type:complete